jgi:hypothetical protein
MEKSNRKSQNQRVKNNFLFRHHPSNKRQMRESFPFVSQSSQFNRLVLWMPFGFPFTRSICSSHHSVIIIIIFYEIHIFYKVLNYAHTQNWFYSIYEKYTKIRTHTRRHT